VRLRYAADVRTLVFVTTFFTLVAVQWTVAPLSLFGGSAAVGVPLLLLTFCFSFFGAVATHNAVHCPVFEKRWANHAFQVVLSLTYGHMVSTFVPGHNLSHHKHTQTPRDVMRTTKLRFRWHLLNGLLFFVVVAHGILKGERRYVAAMKQRRRAWYRQLRLEQFVLYGLYAALLGLDWQRFVVLVFLPHKFAAWGIVTMNMIQHDGCDADRELGRSRNFVGRALNYFVFNNGYHTIHHMYPRLHWSLAPAAHAKEVAPRIHPSLEQSSLLAYVVRTFVWPGRRVRYDGAPLVLPDAAPDEAWVPSGSRSGTLDDARA
jgi:fatty acid desaturase